MNDVSDNLRHILDDLAAAATAAGRDPAEVQLIAVSKTFPATAIAAAAATPHDLFGESRVQELLAKVPELPSRLRWHFIGHLQSNKIRKVLPLIECLHTIDSLELARDVDRIAGEEGRRVDGLVQVNIGRDGAKHGFSPEAVRAALPELLALPRLNLTGLMTIPPLADDPEKSRPHFAALRELRDDLARETGTPLPHLSMGMSGDFREAIAEGATYVRIGSAIFGGR
jgi:PLP dependent protein